MTVSDERSTPPPLMRARHQSRRAILQALYAWDLNGGDLPVSALMAETIRRGDVGDEAYFREVLTGAIASVEKTRVFLSPALDRPWERIDHVERAILTMAAYELRARTDVPAAVVIDEAIELAREFGGPESHRFVNAVLDRAHHRWRERGRSD